MPADDVGLVEVQRTNGSVEGFVPGAAGMASFDARRIRTIGNEESAEEIPRNYAVGVLDGPRELDQTADAGSSGCEAFAVDFMDHRGWFRGSEPQWEVRGLG